MQKEHVVGGSMAQGREPSPRGDSNIESRSHATINDPCRTSEIKFAATSKRARRRWSWKMSQGAFQPVPLRVAASTWYLLLFPAEIFTIGDRRKYFSLKAARLARFHPRLGPLHPHLPDLCLSCCPCMQIRQTGSSWFHSGSCISPPSSMAVIYVILLETTRPTSATPRGTRGVSYHPRKETKAGLIAAGNGNPWTEITSAGVTTTARYIASALGDLEIEIGVYHAGIPGDPYTLSPWRVSLSSPAGATTARRSDKVIIRKIVREACIRRGN